MTMMTTAVAEDVVLAVPLMAENLYDLVDTINELARRYGRVWVNGERGTRRYGIVEPAHWTTSGQLTITVDGERGAVRTVTIPIGDDVVVEIKAA